ncbi:MAG: glutathione synthase [Rhodospirillales bacterium]|nr:glutathione synthase [Alphaproteobacteria bacterium]MCB1840261.1 glutathione synthase [Alphaproteobacteria bacterium]MCB9975988.1 glutathione synthase [Rhodospirillales bacterium]
MTLRVAVQMDPIESLEHDVDSTFALIVEARKRGYSVHYYTPANLSLLDGRVLARARSIDARMEKENYYTVGEEVILDLRQDVDIVLMRQDPPFNMEYITASHILDHLYPKTLVINDPFEVRNAPEKLLVTHFKNLVPPTLITADPEAIKEFYAQHRDVILKPLYDYGGSLVFHVDEKSDNLGSLIDMFQRFYKEAVIVQKFIPEVKTEGDKRIILIEGKPVGGFLRVPGKQEVRAGLYLGGRAEKCEMSERDLQICEAIGPELVKRGLVFAGIDVIGGFLTEINVTCPSGVQDLNMLYDECIEAKLWDAFERRYEQSADRR